MFCSSTYSYFWRCTVGVHTHIFHLEGLESLSRFLDRREKIDIPTPELVDMVRIILEGSYFEFEFYQKWDTAIGTKFSPAYAKIFIAEFERCFLQFDALYKPYIWWRLLDVFIIWIYSRIPLWKISINS